MRSLCVRTRKYLARNAPHAVRWAIAGRSQAKLDALKARLIALHPQNTAVDTLIASVDDPASLQRMAAAMRSAAALDDYGPDFSYSHNFQHASLGHALASLVVFGLVAFLVRFAPLRAFFLNMVKPSGTGPTQAQMDASWFKLRFIADCAGQTVQTEVSGGDPGYAETSKMLAEAALCLVLDRALLPERAGILTTVEAMGDVLLARLQRAGLRFRVL